MSLLDQKGFLTHPYLLGPTDNGMTIVWETARPIDSEVIVEGGGQHFKLKPQVNSGTPWQHFSEGTSFSRLRLNELQAETRYQYHVKLSDGTSETGSFKTLSSNPKKVRFLFLSDTHNFKIADQMSECILAGEFDFAVHGGDLLVGSSVQKDQYQLWFEPMRDVLRSVPFLYIKGNHDEGPYFDDYFTHGQRDVYPSDPLTGNNLSVHCGPVHLLLGNSNPWSLMEMSAETAGFKLDEYWKSVISSSCEWIGNTLASPAVQDRSWRICIFHHHYLDARSRKYIVPLVENNAVELTLMGHVHAYQHTLSASGDNHYVSIGDSIKASSDIDYSHPSKLLMEDIPELLALGQCDYAVVTVDDERLQLDLHTVSQPRVISSQIWDKNTAPIVVRQVSLSSLACDAAEGIWVNATLTNTAPFARPATLKALLDGKTLSLSQFTHQKNTSVLRLDAGESQQVSCKLTFSDAGQHVLCVNDQIFEIDVTPSPACFSFSKAVVKTGQGIDSNLVTLQLTVQNSGSLAGDYSVSMEVNSKEVRSKLVALDGNGHQTLHLQHRIELGGLYQIGANGKVFDEVEVQHRLTILPRVIDQSGSGHHAILHGQPVLQESDGIIGIRLDGNDDYVEIPAHPDLSPNIAFSTQVKAKIHSLQGCNRFDHFALFSKGPSLGYGPNYLMRLAVRDTGYLTAGISFNIDEYFWDGGQIKLSEWTNYAASFDRAQGGSTWVDTVCAANIAGIGDQAVIRNWPDYPIFIGLAYLGYVQRDLGRAKYYSLLNADLQRFRFYDRAIGKQDLCTNQEEQATDNNLKVDLDFSKIEAYGSYISPWFGEFPVHKIELHIDLPSRCKARIQTTVGTLHKDAALSHGKNTIELVADTGEALRFTLVLEGFMQISETMLPIVEKLILKGVGKSRIWSTAADWSQGQFDGALGFENKHRLRNFPDDGSW